MKLTQRNCIMCGLVIFAIILTMYLFRHYTLIEGFDFSMPSSSSISMPSTSSLSMPSMPSSLSSLSFSSSEFGNIGPLPADNKWTDQTTTDFKAAFKTANGADITDAQLPFLYRSASEDDAKYYISNGKWEYPSYYTNCINDSLRKALVDDAAKNGKPPPTEEEIQKFIDTRADPKRLQQSPIRQMLASPMSLKMMFNTCIGILKETIFIGKMMWPFNAMGGGEAGEITTKDNGTIKCAPKAVPGSATKVVLMKNSLDPTTNQSTSIETSFDQLPSLVAGFNYLKDGKISDGSVPCDCNNFSMCPFSLDDQGVSPFYQAYWGTPSATGSSSGASVSDSNAAEILTKIKTELNANPDI
jgi:hypothetical protein